MNNDNLTIEQAKQLVGMFVENLNSKTEGLNQHLGEKVIIRTYSAGVWFGTLVEKSGSEVILKDARRLYLWKAKESISLSAVAKYGLTEESKICTSVEKQWLVAIEILSMTTSAIESIEKQEDVEAE